MEKILFIFIFLYTNCFFAQDTIYFPNDSLKAVGKYSEGYKSGFWEWYWWNGNKQSEGNYYRNNPIGKWTNWNKDGTINVIVNYDSLGQKDGQFIEFDYRISETHELWYDKDKLNGKAIWKSFTGNILLEGEYVDNKREGNWKWYWKNGVVQAEGMMVDSLFHGRWIYYYENLNLDCVGKFVSGKKEGVWKFYWELTGNIKKKGKFKNNKEVGIWMFYDNKGKLINKKKYK